MRKLKDEFFSLAAHEIRTPITVIKAQAQLAERFHAQGKLQGEVIEKTLRTFVQESDRLARLCNDLLDIARLDSDCFEVHLTVFDLGELVRECIQKHALRRDSHGFQLELLEGVLVRADRERCQQVINNLVSNAIRYSPHGGDIVVRLSMDKGFAQTSVRDHGLGISQDKIRNLFRRYYQAHQTGLKGPCGLGLGLYLCREALRRMGGNIRAKSEGPGHGAEFTFTLPLGDSNDIHK